MAEQRWAGGTIRSSDGQMQVLQPAEVCSYPQNLGIVQNGNIVSGSLMVRAGAREIELARCSTTKRMTPDSRRSCLLGGAVRALAGAES